MKLKPVRLLIDECLSPELVGIAEARGIECAHVAHRGWGGYKDWELMREVVAGDWTLVTNNAIDFRGRDGTGGHHGKAELHAGLVCLGCGGGMNLDIQRDLFEAALDEIVAPPDLVNKVVEVYAATAEDDEFEVEIYDLPESE